MSEQPDDRERGGARFGDIPPEVLEWALVDFDEEETLAGFREIRETGGLRLCDFIQELEQIASPAEDS